MPFLFALISETKLITPSDLRRMARAMERHGRDVEAAYNLAPMQCEIADARAMLPRWAHPIVFVDDDQDPGALAVHYYDPVRSGPAARVYVDRATGLNTGSQSIVESATHESSESACNPRVNLWVPHPVPARRAEGVEVAYECADPCQDTYVVEVAGDRWQFANFVTPHWFDGALYDTEVRLRFLRSGGRFDHAGRLEYPGQVGTEGYVILRAQHEGRWRIWFEDAPGSRFGSAPPPKSKRDERSKAHAMARRFAIEKALGA